VVELNSEPAGRQSAVFCDSIAALQHAHSQGLSHDLPVLTGSPFLFHASGIRSTYLLDRLGDRRAAIHGSRRSLQSLLGAAARSDELISDYADLAATHGLHALAVATLAACLDEADFSAPRVVLDAVTDNTRFDAIHRGPWQRLLAANPELAISSYQIERTDKPRFSDEALAGSVLDRFRLAGLARLAYRSIVKTGLSLPGPVARRRIWIAEENELVKETATALAFAGCAVRKLPSIGTSVELEPHVAERLRDLCGEVLTPRLAPYVLAPALAPLLRLIADSLIAKARVLHRSQVWFTRFFDEAKHRSRAVVLTNSPWKPFCLGVRNACRPHGIPVFGFQHGATTEICGDHESTFSIYHTRTSDRAYMFNERSAATENAIPDRVGDARAVGMPADFRRVSRKSSRGRSIPPITFASTALYAAYSGKIWYGLQTDREMMALELRLIEDVLGGIRHRVLYKPYPSMRFLDDDPVWRRAAEFENIDVHSDGRDLRYLVGASRLLLTMRATSTASWCLFSGKPLVFLDVADSAPLRPEAKAAFASALFLFSTEDAGWAQALRSFLDQPLDEIDRQWREKAPARKAMVLEFFDKGGAAGRYAAHDIIASTAGGAEKGWPTVPATGTVAGRG
jgi:hypothetical protein